MGKNIGFFFTESITQDLSFDYHKRCDVITMITIGAILPKFGVNHDILGMTFGAKCATADGTVIEL